MASYLVWRLAVDFLKPQPLVGGMNVIQWACVMGLLAVAFGSVSRVRFHGVPPVNWLVK
jgi:hypothetical protein